MKFIYVLSNPHFDVQGEEVVYKIGWTSNLDGNYCSASSTVVYMFEHERAGEILDLVMESEVAVFRRGHNRRMLTCPLELIEKSVRRIANSERFEDC